MKCYNCRTEIAEGASFCPKCGSPQKFTDFVNRALKNDQEAVAQLYKMTYNSVYQTIRTAADLDDDTVFDLIQNTYIKAFRNLSQLKEPEAFRGWIKVIGRNLTIDHLRKKKVVVFSQMVSVDSDEMVEFEDNRIENLPEIVVDQKETARLLGEILNQLSEEQRIAVHMYYFEQLSVKEIADILGVSEGTVKSRLNYGRKKIEAGVNELEKKGTKLYGLAPIPFLLALFRSQEVHAAILPDHAILQAVEKELASGLSGSVQDGGTINTKGQKTAMAAGKETAKTTASAVGKSVLTKVIAGVAATAVIGAGAVGIKAINREDKTAVKEESVINEESALKQENETKEQEAPTKKMTADDSIDGYANEEYMPDLSDLYGHICKEYGSIHTMDSNIILNSDGTFTCVLEYYDMGDLDAEYPDGTCYISEFEGVFSNPIQVDAYTYRLPVKHVEQTNQVGSEYIKDNIRYIVQEDSKFSQLRECYIYLPGTPFQIRDGCWVSLGEKDLFYIGPYYEDLGKLLENKYVLCCGNEMSVFLSESKELAAESEAE